LNHGRLFIKAYSNGAMATVTLCTLQEDGYSLLLEYQSTLNSSCIQILISYNFLMQRVYVGTVLVLLQVFIITLGQGALTLCVRKDGSQALEWTAAGPCQSMKSASHEACGHQVCFEDEDEIALRCDPCTDYLLVAEVVAVLDVKPAHLIDGASDLCWYMPIACNDYSLHLISLMAHPPPPPLISSLAALGASVVRRC